MKKILNIIIKVMPIIIVLAIVLMPMLTAAGVISITDEPAEVSGSTTTMVTKVWSIVRTSLQVAALGAFIFAGVRYMFASADQKADLKKSLSILAVGALIVFGSTIVIDILKKIVQDITGV